MDTLSGHDIEGGDCFVKVAHIVVMGQTVVKDFKGWGWG